MLSFLARGLDQWTIYHAARGMRMSSGNVPRADRLSALLNRPGFFDAEIPSSIQLQFDSLGRFDVASPVTTEAAALNRVHGRLFARNRDWRNGPVVILLHGWNAELCYRFMFPYWARRLMERGISVITFELPYHLQRRPRTGPVSDFISEDLAAMIEASRQTISEIRMLGTWLSEQGVPSIGLWGFSLGAWLSGFALQYPVDWKFAVLETPIVDVGRAVRELTFCEPTRRALNGGSVNLGPLNLSTYPVSLEPSRILIIEALYDMFAPADAVESLWRTWGQTEIWRVHHGHVSVLASASVLRRTVEWIVARVGLGSIR